MSTAAKEQVAKSFATLVKYNNGAFKSEAQAKFLLSQCQDENHFYSGGSVHGNSYMLCYECDTSGVLRVVKMLKSKPDAVTWERRTEEQQAELVATRAECEKMSLRMNRLIQLCLRTRATTRAIGNNWMDYITANKDLTLLARIVAKRRPHLTRLESLRNEAIAASDAASSNLFRLTRQS